MATQEQINRANDISVQIAQAELIRILVAQVFNNQDPAVFQANIQSVFNAASGSLNGRKLFNNLDDQTELYIKQTATTYMHNLLNTIGHSSEKPQ